jgi:hypothetical protein
VARFDDSVCGRSGVLRKPEVVVAAEVDALLCRFRLGHLEGPGGNLIKFLVTSSLTMRKLFSVKTNISRRKYQGTRTSG